MIYDTPRFLPGGDRFLLIEFGNEMRLDLNFFVHGVARAIATERTRGVIETSPAYASLLVHYDPNEVSLDRLKEEFRVLASSLGAAVDARLESRLFYFPTAYLDPWSEEAVNRYIEKFSKEIRDPELVVESNDLENVEQLVRVYSGTEYWVAAIGWWPWVPFMMPLDPRCRLTAPRYNPPGYGPKKEPSASEAARRESTQKICPAGSGYLLARPSPSGIGSSIYPCLRIRYVCCNPATE